MESTAKVHLYPQFYVSIIISSVDQFLVGHIN